MSNSLNTTPLRNVRLGGALGKLYGKKHRFALQHPIEAIKALRANYDGFENYMNSSSRRGITYAVFSGKRNLQLDELEMDKGTEDIYIMPVVIGSKQAGLFQTILGVALIAAATFFTGGIAGIAAGGAWGMVGAVGISMTLGGVIQMLSPQTTGLASKQDSDNKASYAFGGVTNTAAQGYPVPLLYGKRLIGGAIISAGIYVEDQQ